ncbi:MAG: hypothetical protein IPK24_23750 [Kineosporiaceae bacterium]|nr:hypothetical protein [Kineosporiaceae bacterium]
MADCGDEPLAHLVHVTVRGRLVVLARGIPVLEDDAQVLSVPAVPSVGEFGAVTFTRDLGRWLGRLFDVPVDGLVYRENRWDHRPYPRAQSHEVQIAGHLIRVTAYDVLTDDRLDVRTAHAIAIDTHAPFLFTPRRPALHLDWQLACAAWCAVNPG